MVGGTATLLNLTIVTMGTLFLHWAYVPVALGATEAGVLLSFSLNDRLTFHTLAPAAGTWLKRCLRFHGGYVVGQVLTILLAGSMIAFLRWSPPLAQAIAIALVVFVNFTIQRFWTYRRRSGHPLVGPHQRGNACAEKSRLVDLQGETSLLLAKDAPDKQRLSALLRVRQMLSQPMVSITLCWLAALAMIGPHLMTPFVRDEADFVVAAQAIDQRGVPVFYQSDVELSGRPVLRVGSVPGLAGPSTVYEDPDGAFTWVENGGISYKVGNWHPPLYLYLLALFLLLPLPLMLAARLLNLLLLAGVLILLYRLSALLPSKSRDETQVPLLRGTTRSFVPLASLVLYLGFTFGIRSSVLVDFTTTLSPLTVLLFWDIHLRAPQNGKGVVLRALALLLVLWSNLGPVPALALAVVLIPLLRWETRSMLVSISAVCLALMLFGLTFGLYSLWEGIPAGATFAHSSAIVSRTLLALPHPTGWAHLTRGASMVPLEVFLLVLYGPLVAGGAVLVLMRYVRWRFPPRLMLPLVIGGAPLLALLLSAGYLKWQHVSVTQGLVLGWEWIPAVGKLLVENWAASPFISWLLPGMACTLLLASARQGSPFHRSIVEMAAFALLMTGDVLFVGPDAWGFPKYVGPVYPVLILLSVLLVHGLWTGQVKLHQWRTFLVSTGSATALCWMLGMVVFGCQPPDALPGICSNQSPVSPLGWLSVISALNVVACGALVALTGRYLWKRSLATEETQHVIGALIGGLLLPLLVFALLEEAAMPGPQGSITYEAGDITGLQEAGHFLATHVAPGQLVLARKEIMVFAPTLRYIDDFQVPDTLIVQNRAIVWVVRPQLSISGFRQLAHRGAWGMYYRAPPRAAARLPTTSRSEGNLALVPSG